MYFRIKQYKDKRSPAEKYRDIISIINGKLDPELASLWSDLCQYDVAHECFYQSGIAYLERDMKLLQKQFKYNKEIKLDPVINMPDCIKSTEHSIHCEPNNQKCTYMTKIRTQKKIKTPPTQEQITTLKTLTLVLICIGGVM